MSTDEIRGRSVAVKAGTGVPLHRQLFLVLHDEIARGAIRAGDLLPTEHALCDQFGVSRITVRRALADLANQGYILRRQGVGSFVREHNQPVQHAASRSYMDEVRQTQFLTAAEVLEFDLRAAPQTVSDKLGFAGDLLHILRVRRERRTGEPLLVTEAWLSAALVEIVTAEKLGRTALHGLLAEAGVTIEYVEHEFTAEIAGPRTAQLVDIDIGAPVLRVNRVAFTAGDRPHHYLSILLSPSRSRILLKHSAEELVVDDNMAIAHDVWRPEAGSGEWAADL